MDPDIEEDVGVLEAAALAADSFSLARVLGPQDLPAVEQRLHGRSSCVYKHYIVSLLQRQTDEKVTGIESSYFCF